jgi:hypothetical protein
MRESLTKILSPLKRLGVHIQIEPKTDIVALAAFLLALGGVIFQVTAFLRDAEVTLFGPEQILITAEDRDDPGSIVRISASMSYVNTGQVGYNAIVHNETLHFDLGGKTYEQKWQAFVTWSPMGSDIKYEIKSAAVPFPVNAGSSESHVTFFAPRSNFLAWQEFSELLTDVNELHFRFKARSYRGERVPPASCTVELPPLLKVWIADNRWIVASCRESQ